MNLEADSSGVAYWAWKKSADKISQSSPTNSSFEIFVGPNSGILNQFPKEATDITSRLYGGYDIAAKNYFVSFSLQDSTWAENKLIELLADSVQVEQLKKDQQLGENGVIKSICPSVERCHSSTVFTNRLGVSITLAGYSPSRTTNFIETQGPLQSHEYAHIIQNRQFLGTGREDGGIKNSGIYMQDWMIEGGADFSLLVSTYRETYSEYLVQRTLQVNRVPKKTADWYENFMMLSNSKLSEYMDGEVYSVGFMINEIFASIKGPTVQMDLFKEVANGKTFAEAFEKVFGMPWKYAAPIIARVIAKETGKS